MESTKYITMNVHQETISIAVMNATGKLETLTSLNDVRLVESYTAWSGLAPDGPLVLRDIGKEEICALHWERRSFSFSS
jgi:hypothetical protein